MDWQGLLKWSLQHSDGTQNKDLKPMDEDTKKWLTEAFESFSFDEVKRMQEIVEQIMQPEQGTEQDEENRVALMDELEELVSGLDRAQDFCTIGGMSALVQLMLTTKYQEVQMVALRIFGASVQNNPKVQEYCASLGAFEIMNLMASNKVNQKIKEQLVSALSSFVRGENLANKRRLIDRHGMEVLIDLIKQYPNSLRVREKTLNIFRDLLLYDSALHRTYHDLNKFANTHAGLNRNKKGEKPDLREDINEELLKNNELPENQKYRDIVKQTLPNIGFLQQDFINLMLSDLSDKFQESRVAFMECLSKILDTQSGHKVKSIINEYREKILKMNETNKGNHDVELEFCQKLMSL